MKKNSSFIIVTLLSTIIFFSCQTEETAKPAFDLANAKSEIEAANQVTMDAFAKGDSVGIANTYLEDAKLMFTGMPAVVGRAGIQSIYSGFIKSGVSKIEIKTNQVWGSEDILAEDGSKTIYVKDQVVGQEKFIVLWKKVEGKWKIMRDIANSDLAAQPSN